MSYAYFKEGVGSRCNTPKCNKARWSNDSIDYIVFGQTHCEEHAKEECIKYNLLFPGEFPNEMSAEQKKLLEFLQDNLELVNRYHGGCPEENYPADQDLYLVLAGKVISEVRLNG